MEQITLKGIPVVVSIEGKGQPLLCLHGWGGSHESFTELREALGGDPVQIIAPDLPGFGGSGKPPRPFTVDDYADCISELVHMMGLSDVLLLGHSHGGRIAIALAAGKPEWLRHLFLCAAAGIPEKATLRKTFGLFTAKVGGLLLGLPFLRAFSAPAKKILYRLLRVHDYERAEGVMRETMQRVIREDLTPRLGSIIIPTDIFWGEEDTFTPLWMGKKMNTLIAQSVFHSFPGVQHRVHRDRAVEIAEIIREK